MSKLQERFDFCTQLVKEYLPNYTFRFNNRLTTTNGRILFNEKRIEMATRLAMNGNDESVLNNVLHEIAHGLHPMDGHGNVWKRTFLKLGGNGKRCNTYEGVTYKKRKVKYKYKISCEKGHDFKKRKKFLDVSRYHCTSCRRQGEHGKLTLIPI